MSFGISAATGLSVVTEVLDARKAERVAAHAGVLQIGARNLQSYPLLRKIGMLRRPLLLERTPPGTLEELLEASEHVMAASTRDGTLCGRGIRTGESSARNTPDVTAVPVLKRETRLPASWIPGTRREPVRSLLWTTGELRGPQH